MDGLAKLTAEHRHICELASQLRAADAAGDAEAVRELTRRITAEMNAVAALEEEVLYPAVRDVAPELASQVDEALAEHVIAKELLFEAATSEAVAGIDDTPDVALVTEAVQHMMSEERLLEAVRTGAGAGAGGLADVSEAVAERSASMEEAGAAGRALKEQDEALKDPAQVAAAAADLALDHSGHVRNQ